MCYSGAMSQHRQSSWGKTSNPQKAVPYSQVKVWAPEVPSGLLHVNMRHAFASSVNTIYPFMLYTAASSVDWYPFKQLGRLELCE